jgi:hypothetical protein
MSVTTEHRPNQHGGEAPKVRKQREVKPKTGVTVKFDLSKEEHAKLTKHAESDYRTADQLAGLTVRKHLKSLADEA